MVEGIDDGVKVGDIVAYLCHIYRVVEKRAEPLRIPCNQSYTDPEELAAILSVHH
jgi:hypothetical protein